MTTLKTNLIFRISHLALCLWAFFAHWQKVKNKDFRGAIVQKQYVLRGSVKLCFEEHRNLAAKNWLCIFSLVLSQRSAKNSHIIQFQLANFERMYESLHVSGLLAI